MISIQGTIKGEELRICYMPSDQYMRDATGRIVVAGRVYAHITREGDNWLMAVVLPDNTELLSPAPNPWVWLVEETSKQGRYHYFLPSDPAVLTYAASRPRRAMVSR